MNLVYTLMNRDCLTLEEAKNEVLVIRKFCADCDYDYMEIENFMLEEYGLEMDYIIELIM